jgi:hypothetical protein
LREVSFCRTAWLFTAGIRMANERRNKSEFRFLRCWLLPTLFYEFLFGFKDHFYILIGMAMDQNERCHQVFADSCAPNN